MLQNLKVDFNVTIFFQARRLSDILEFYFEPELYDYHIFNFFEAVKLQYVLMAVLFVVR